MVSCGLVADNRENVVPIEDTVFLAIHFDFRAAVFADEDAVTGFDFHGGLLAIITGFARADGDDQAFHWFFFGGIRDNNPTFFAVVRLFLDRFDDDPITYWSHVKLHTFIFLSFVSN